MGLILLFLFIRFGGSSPSVLGLLVSECGERGDVRAENASAGECGDRAGRRRRDSRSSQSAAAVTRWSHRAYVLSRKLHFFFFFFLVPAEGRFVL